VKIVRVFFGPFSTVFTAPFTGLTIHVRRMPPAGLEPGRFPPIKSSTPNGIHCLCMGPPVLPPLCTAVCKSCGTDMALVRPRAYLAPCVIASLAACSTAMHDIDRAFHRAPIPSTFAPFLRCTSAAPLALLLPFWTPNTVHELNVKNVFLHDTLSETVYCFQPANFVDPKCASSTSPSIA
jgi:hypothetical protein